MAILSIIIIALRMRVSPSQCFSRPPSGAPPASAGFSTIIFNKFNQHACATAGENKNVFVINTLRMRVNPSLLVFNL